MPKDENELNDGDRVKTPLGLGKVASYAHYGLLGDEPYYLITLDEPFIDRHHNVGPACFPRSQLKVIPNAPELQ